MKKSSCFRINYLKRMYNQSVNITNSGLSLSEEDRIRGGLFGSLIGDTIGSTIEFKMKISEQMIKDSFKFSGSPIFNTLPGQITDDGELIMCLGQALNSYKFDIENIAKFYNKWATSKPFDIGNTIRNSIFKTGSSFMKKAALNCAESESNGALMKLIPLAIWCRNLPESQIIEYIYSDCELTHANPKCKIINLAYTLLVKYIFENESRENSFNRMKQYLLNQANYQSIFEASINKTSFDSFTIQNDIESWFKSINSPENLNLKNIGHVKIAFILSLNIFLQNKSYDESLKMMLKFGGDTDTNCAILGGLIGSYEGAENIPKAYKDKILECDPSKKGGHPVRDKFLIPKYSLETVIYNLLTFSPRNI